MITFAVHIKKKIYDNMARSFVMTSVPMSFGKLAICIGATHLFLVSLDSFGASHMKFVLFTIVPFTCTGVGRWVIDSDVTK